MSKKQQKGLTPEMVRQAVVGAFLKLNPKYMMKNPVCLLLVSFSYPFSVSRRDIPLFRVFIAAWQ